MILSLNKRQTSLINSEVVIKEPANLENAYTQSDYEPGFRKVMLSYPSLIQGERD